MSYTSIPIILVIVATVLFALHSDKGRRRRIAELFAQRQWEIHSIRWRPFLTTGLEGDQGSAYFVIYTNEVPEIREVVVVAGREDEEIYLGNDQPFDHGASFR